MNRAHIVMLVMLNVHHVTINVWQKDSATEENSLVTTSQPQHPPGRVIMNYWATVASLRMNVHGRMNIRNNGRMRPVRPVRPNAQGAQGTNSRL